MALHIQLHINMGKFTQNYSIIDLIEFSYNCFDCVVHSIDLIDSGHYSNCM